MDIKLESYAPKYFDAIMAGSSSWQELAESGAPYWRPRSHAEIARKAQSMAGPGLASEYNYVITCDGTPIGEGSIHSIALRDRVAQLGICIWDTADRGKGIGGAALDQLMDWATGYLDIRRLEAWIVNGNRPSVALFSSRSFTFEGTHRERYLCAGTHHDVDVYARLMQ